MKSEGFPSKNISEDAPDWVDSFACKVSSLPIAFLAFVTLYYNDLPIIFIPNYSASPLKSVIFNVKDEIICKQKLLPYRVT